MAEEKEEKVDKEKLLKPLRERKQSIAQINELLTAANSAIGSQAAEIYNSDKMVYTDRKSGEVKPWGVDKELIASWQKAEKEALKAAKDLIEKLLA